MIHILGLFTNKKSTSTRTRKCFLIEGLIINKKASCTPKPIYTQRKVVLNEAEFQLTDNHIFKPSNRSKPLKLDYKPGKIAAQFFTNHY